MTNRIFEWFDKKMKNAVDEVTPDWVKLLIPIHVALLIGIWFIN